MSSLLLPHPKDGDVVTGRGFAAPPPSASSSDHRSPPRGRSRPGYDQLKEPGSFQPISMQYSPEDLEPTRDQQLVSGPPLGKTLIVMYFIVYDIFSQKTQVKKAKLK